MLINFTASSGLGIHEVNEACTLIREATSNNDVQISFGVVVNEDMGEDVKITVIATGFKRDNLPEIERRPASEFFGESSERESTEELVSDPPVVEDPPIEEPDLIEVAEDAPMQETVEDELDIPTFMRNERQLFQ